MRRTTMNRTKFFGHTAMVRELSAELNMGTGMVETILNKLIDKVQEHLFAGDIVRLKHTCSVRLVHCPEREMYSYNADKRIHLPARRRIRVAAAKHLDNMLKEEAK